ncbi:MAG: LytTR family DNA-binding domain-containing protein [Cyclobacteriaceae bacterium]
MRKISCITIDDDKAFMQILVALIEQVNYLELIGKYNDPLDGFNAITELKPEIIFLDVEMPNMTGIELLGTLEDQPEIILITSKKNYAIDAFSFNVTDYLLKPVQRPRFLQAVNRAKENIEKNSLSHADDKNIFVKVDSQLLRLELDKLLYIEAFGDYVKLFISNDKFHTVYSTLKQVEALLPPNDFAKVHRSFIVRIDKIENIEQTNLQLGTRIIPVSYQQRKILLTKIRSL